MHTFGAYIRLIVKNYITFVEISASCFNYQGIIINKKQTYMENKTFKTHMIYINYPMNSLNLKEMEDNITSLEVNLGDVVIVDCEGMDYICSSGLRVFLGLYKMIAQKGGKLIIRNLQPLVKNVFDMSGFSQIFNIE